MDNYQKELFEKFKPFLLERNEAPYPPQHEGDYLEEYFVDNFRDNKQVNDRFFIPVHWTAVFNFKVKEGLGPGTENYSLRHQLFEEIKKLDPNKKYFTVSTHDDAPMGGFPKDTKHFYAGGNSDFGTDPIPLIWSGFKSFEDPQKMMFCSFVGSVTHDVRRKMLQVLDNQQGYLLRAYHWQQSVPEDQQKLFKTAMEHSRFTLCPRGYGSTSYRLYESMQLGSIPVYISDKLLLPWSDELNWDDFCVLVHPSNLDKLDSKLKNYTEAQVRKMQLKLQEVYPLYFTIPAAYNQIIKRL